MKGKRLRGIIPSHFLSEAEIIENDKTVLLGHGIPALRKTFQVLHFLVVTDVIQQVFIPWEEV
jgi:hypothetical protein